MVILDTNIIIDHLRRKKGESWLMKISQLYPKESLGISIVTVQELYEGKSTKQLLKEQLMLATITPLKIFAYTWEIAKLAGEIARDLPSPLEFADAAIAATAIINRAKLLTLNQKDFSKISQLHLFDLTRCLPAKQKKT